MVRRSAAGPVSVGRLNRLLTLALKVRSRTLAGPSAAALAGSGAGGDLATRLFTDTSSWATAAVPSPAPPAPTDPQRPRRPRNSYFHFRAETGGTAEQWKKMSELERSPYQTKAADDRKLYSERLEEYGASGRKAWWKAKIALEREPSRRHRDPQKPRKPMGAFFLFAQDRRDPKLSVTENAKVAGEKWRAKSDHDKGPWIQRADELRREYVRQMEAYEASGREVEWLAGLVSERAVDPQRPKKPMTPFFFYLKERHASSHGMDAAEVGKLAGETWKKMSVYDKRPYLDQAAEAKRKYEEELLEYEASGKGAAWDAKAREWSRSLVEDAEVERESENLF